MEGPNAALPPLRSLEVLSSRVEGGVPSGVEAVLG